ncbi:MAG: antibiotic biosynthesis monooxygenase [Cyclobacteriaceae bacterium]
MEIDQSNEKASVAVIFEVIPAENHMEEYLDIAQQLLRQLNQIEGFISIERFSSLNTPGKILSLSYWRDEEAVREWRNTEDHRWAQSKGRNEVFSDYRLRVVNVLREYGMNDRLEAPNDSKVHHKK